MSDSSLFTAALQSTANFKHHITEALKQKDFYIFFISITEIYISKKCSFCQTSKSIKNFVIMIE